MDIGNRFVDRVYCSIPVCRKLCFRKLLVTLRWPIGSLSGNLLADNCVVRNCVLESRKLQIWFSEYSHMIVQECTPAAHSASVVGDLLELSATFSPFCVIFPVSLAADVLVLQDMTFV